MLMLRNIKRHKVMYSSIAGFIAFVISLAIWRSITHENFIPVSITGVNQMGRNYNVAEFYVNGYWAANIGREGGGGSSVCCVMLPDKWRAGLTVEVDWVVNDWSKEIQEEIVKGNYESVLLDGEYKATVPVEKYDKVGRLYVHFFSGGSVRVVSGKYGPDSSLHVVQMDDPSASVIATRGKRVIH